MRIKITENENGTWSLYNQTEKRFIIENGTKQEVDELKKQIDQLRKDRNALNRGIR
jgi:predicted Fe-S protein YdhL (DUF1289 family)